MSQTTRSLSDLDLTELQAEFAAAGLRPGHARTLLRAYYATGGEVDLEALRVGRPVRQYLERHLALRPSQVRARQVSGDGTRKLLVGFPAGGSAEAVLMPAPRADRAAGCISSQIGCAMGCGFCASTRGGLERNLTAGEMVEQFLHLRAEAAGLGRRLATLVYMGMGEPLLNLSAVIGSIRRIAGVGMGELGGRQITVSTVGIVPGIHQLAEADLNVHLALSLHAPDDATRARLMPANRRYGVAEIMAAARAFQQRTGRIVTLEYCLLAGINDHPDQAGALAELVAGFRAHVNLIPFNPIGPGLDGQVYLPPSPARVAAFLDILRARGVVAHARRPRGPEIDAACGQLRRREERRPGRVG
jgi:23S rRNA (adenine2503-C2)-methyltransferase